MEFQLPGIAVSVSVNGFGIFAFDLDRTDEQVSRGNSLGHYEVKTLIAMREIYVPVRIGKQASDI
jgi:hypothetical protein